MFQKRRKTDMVFNQVSFSQLLAVLELGLLLCGSFVTQVTAQKSEYCDKLQGFEEVEIDEVNRHMISVGLTARKVEIAGQCPGGVAFENEQTPTKTLLSVCQQQKAKTKSNVNSQSPVFSGSAQISRNHRLLFNVTQFCFDKFRRRTLRQVLLDVGIGVDNRSFPFVQFLEELPGFGPKTILADPYTFRTKPLENKGFCENLTESYTSIDARDVVDILDLATTLYKVSLQLFCPFGIFLKDSLAPARMLQNACLFNYNPNEYWLRFESDGFCIVWGSFLSGRGYSRRDTYDVLVTRQPKSAYWINFASSTFSLDQPEAAGLAPLTPRILKNVSPRILIPDAVRKLLGPSPAPKKLSPSPSPSPPPPLVSPPPLLPPPTSPPPSPPPSPPSDYEILIRIIDGTDDSQDLVKNVVIGEISQRALQKQDPELLELAFNASTAVNGNTGDLFETIGGLVTQSEYINTTIEAVEGGINSGLTEAMAEGIAGTLSGGTQWMQLIDEAIQQNSCQPVAQLLNGVRDLSIDAEFESDFVHAVGRFNGSMLPCLTSCDNLDGFRTGGPFTIEDQTNSNIGYNTQYTDRLIDSRQCPGRDLDDPSSIANDPDVVYPSSSPNPINVKCVSRTNSIDRTYFVQIDVKCWNAEDVLENLITVLEITARNRTQPTAVPISVYSLTDSDLE